MASSKFRSFSYLQPVYRGLNFEGHYFDVEDKDVGTINGSWTFRLREGIKLTPGLGVSFGQNLTTAPAFTFRWDVEQGPIVSQGLFIQAFRKSPQEHEEEAEPERDPKIWDGNHVSYCYERLEVGPSWEHIHAREGDEWKVGGRVAYRLMRNVTAVMFVMAPDTEVRFGVIDSSATGRGVEACGLRFAPLGKGDAALLVAGGLRKRRGRHGCRRSQGSFRYRQAAERRPFQAVG